MPAIKFKIGQRVRVLNALVNRNWPMWSSRIGWTGTVRGFTPAMNLQVQFDRQPDRTFACRRARVEKIADKPFDRKVMKYINQELGR